jgi:gamma-glutamylcyclotransferase (GGCT)/AIG2-like uncharacterized protein YtfP
MVMAEWEKPADSDVLVFVYGSLRQGRSNHEQMRGCRWQGNASLPGFALYDLGPFPMAVASQDPRSRLWGEVYAVPLQQLVLLDRFEGVPRLYERIERTLEDGRPVWVYVGRPRQVRYARRLPEGEWPGRQTPRS